MYNPNRRAGKKQALRRIRREMNEWSNQHELVVLTPFEIVQIWLGRQVQQGKLSRAEADALAEGAKDGASPEQIEQLKKATEFVIGNVGTWESAWVAKRLIKDVGWHGQYVQKLHGGKTYFIFKGSPGLRSLLTGTRYLAGNPKVVALGIGKLGIREAAIGGARLTIVAIAGYRIVEYLLTDKATLTSLIGKLATDVVKIAVAGLASYLGGMIGGALIAGVVVGPLIGAIAVGLLTSVALEVLDNHFGLTDKLIAHMDRALVEAESGLRNAGSAIVRRVEALAVEAGAAVIEWLVEGAASAAREFMCCDMYPGWHALPRWSE